MLLVWVVVVDFVYTEQHRDHSIKGYDCFLTLRLLSFCRCEANMFPAVVGNEDIGRVATRRTIKRTTEEKRKKME